MVVPVSSPRLGLGMAALGRPGYINLNRESILGSSRSISDMQSQANSVMDKLFESQNKPWLDCARSYGLSEKFVSEYLKDNSIGPEDVYVSSKWGYTYVANWKVELEEGQPHEVKDHSVQNFLKQSRETLDLVGDYLDLYQVHSATVDSGILTNTEVHVAMEDFASKADCKLGLSVSGPAQGQVLTQAMEIKRQDGSPLFDSVQCTYNVFEQRPHDALLKAHESGMDIIIKEGMANGRVLRSQELASFSSKLNNCSTDALALACILAQPFEPRVLSGAATVAHLESNLKADELSLDPHQVQEIMSACAMDSHEYWDERGSLKWN